MWKDCVSSSDCPSNMACINQKCVDPCPGTCAPNADCRVINHSPTCNCATGYTGNGFDGCRPIPAAGKNLKTKFVRSFRYQPSEAFFAVFLNPKNLVRH